MSVLVVRLLQPDDDQQMLGRLVQHAYFALPGYPHDPDYDDSLADIAGRVGEAQVVVAELDGELVGCLTFVPDQTSDHHEFDDPYCASFRYFGVSPAAQGQGVGEAMVRWCIDAARAAGQQRLRIHTLETMPGAQRLYQRLGFARDPEGDEEWDGIKGLAYVFHC